MTTATVAPMQCNVDDDGFVRAPIGLVYRRLTDIDRWSTWWPGVTTTRAGPGDAWDLAAAGRRLSRPLRLHLDDLTWRHDAGFAFHCSGDLDGRGEFWLEPGWGGTVVHHWVSADVRDGNPLAVTRRYRAMLRHGLWGFKDAVQDEVRSAMGLAP